MKVGARAGLTGLEQFLKSLSGDDHSRHLPLLVGHLDTEDRSPLFVDKIAFRLVCVLYFNVHLRKQLIIK